MFRHTNQCGVTMASPGYLGTGITEAQQSSFARNGYIILRGVFTENEIRKLREAGDRAERRWQADPGRIGTDKPYLRRVEPLIEYDDEFVELLDHDAFFPVVRELLGSGIAMLGTSYYTTPPGQGWGDTSEWHIDEALTGPVGAPIPLMVKVSITLDEIKDLDDGPTALIPGSHLQTYNDNAPPPADPRDAGQGPVARFARRRCDLPRSRVPRRHAERGRPNATAVALQLRSHLDEALAGLRAVGSCPGVG